MHFIIIIFRSSLCYNLFVTTLIWAPFLPSMSTFSFCINPCQYSGKKEDSDNQILIFMHFTKVFSLIMLKNGQTFFKNLAVVLIIFWHYESRVKQLFNRISLDIYYWNLVNSFRTNICSRSTVNFFSNTCSK